MKYRATKKLLKAIAEGVFEPTPVSKTTYYVPYYEVLIDINKDWTLTIRVDADAVKNNPDYFEPETQFVFGKKSD